MKLPQGYSLLSSKRSDAPKKSAMPLKEVKAQAEKIKPVVPPTGYVLSSYSPSVLEQLRDSVANSAIGHSLESTLPGIADALNLHPSESSNSPTYEQHKGQILAPEYLTPVTMKVAGSVLPEAERKEFDTKANSERVEGALTAAGNLTSGKNLAIMGGTAVAAGVTAGVVNPVTAGVLSRLVSGGFTLDMLHGLYQQNKEYRKAVDEGNLDEARKLQGEMGVTGIMALLTGKHALTKHPFTPVTEAPARERTNVLHRNGAGEVRQAKGQAPAVWLSPDAWHSLMSALYPGEDAAETHGMNLPANEHLEAFANDPQLAAANPQFGEVQKLLSEAHKNAGDGGVAIGKKRGSLQSNVNVMREELNHTWQRSLANGDVNQHLDPKALTDLYHAIPSGMYEHLVENGYSGHNSPEMVTEAAAKLMDGRPERFGVDEDDAVDFLDRYFNSVTDKHGANALQELHHVRGIAADAKARAIEEHVRTRSGQDNGAVSGVAQGGQGGNAEGIPNAQAVAPAPSTESLQKPLHEMTLDEIKQEHEKAKTRDKQDVIDIFGEEGAKKYNALQRAANNSYDMEKADKAADELLTMEAGLTKEQQNKLYGIGDTRHSEEDLKEYRDAYSSLDDSSPEALGESLKWAVSQVGDPTRAPETMTPKERLRMAQLRHGYDLAVQNGYDPMEVMKSAVKSAAERFSDPEDAKFMLDKVVKALHIGEKGAPQLPAGQDEIDFDSMSDDEFKEYAKSKKEERERREAAGESSGDQHWNDSKAPVMQHESDGVIYQSKDTGNGIEVRAFRKGRKIAEVSFGGENDPKEAFTSGILVPKDLRGKGVAKKLYEQLPSIAKAHGVERIVGEGVQNEGGIGIWKSLAKDGIAKPIEAFGQTRTGITTENAPDVHKPAKGSFRATSVGGEGVPLFNREKGKSDIEHWTDYSKNMTFDSEQEARDWTFRKKQQSDEQYAHFFKPKGEEANRAFADSIPIRREGNKFKIGAKIKTPVSKERFGEREPEGTSPAVDWYGEDLQDTSKKVDEDSILKDYGGGKPGKVYRAYVDPSILEPKLAEEEDEDGGSYAWEDLEATRGRKPVPPAKIVIKQNGKVEISDGNHRIKYWQDQGFDSIPAWIIDRRRGIKIEPKDEALFNREKSPAADTKNDKDEPETKYKFGSTQINLPAESAAHGAITSMQSSIPDTDLAGKGKDVDDPHVTLRYGLKTSLTPELRKFIESQAPFEASLGATKAFPPSEHSDGAAPIVADVESPERVCAFVLR
jgi:GNAT superfamily N-acetyltransferase